MMSWRVPAGMTGGIEGYANPTSVLPGQKVRLYVSTAASRFVVRAFRMGWYGGRLGQQTWVSSSVPGRQQPGPVVEFAATSTYTAHWGSALSTPVTINVKPLVGFGRHGTLFKARVRSEIGYGGHFVWAQRHTAHQDPGGDPQEGHHHAAEQKQQPKHGGKDAARIVNEA